MEEKFIEAKRLIDKAQRILLISHKSPDGDTLGATCALNIVLRNMGKDTTMACADEPSERFLFLPHIRRMVRDFDFREYDLLIVSDAGASYMTKYHEKYPDIFDGDVPVINIDHHASNDNFGNCNIVDIAAASTTVILYRFFAFHDVRVGPDTATALLAGIYNDTGSLMHSNTSLEVFEICAQLTSCGGKVTQITKNMFRATPVSTLKLWGRVLSNARINDEGVTVSVVTWKDFEDCNAGSEEVSGVVDLLNSVPGSKYTCLLNEDRNGKVKGSFRTQRDDVDVAELAAQFGGGGHKKAAGFTMPGRIHQELHWKIVPAQELPDNTALPKLG
ncbi:DHH family phosphoesterase [Patescibacteria group bacterium]|nr:DHH family phosphoesterase [Patescibacteria group bacterium]MBU1702792.1 DHH family phosphoesterase [Patescibacteria group bacterium]MBU1953815.1 DHH family phosphoesterase [Patescibacteria group bacterium]